MHLLIDSLHQLIYAPTEALVETAVAGLMAHCSPLATIARLDLAGKSSYEKTAGDLTRLSLLNSYKAKFSGLGIGAAEFSLTQPNPCILIFVSMDNPMGHKIFMALMTDITNPNRHFLKQILELFAGNMSLALVMKTRTYGLSLNKLLGEILPKLRPFGVEALASWPGDNPSQGSWIGSKGISTFDRAEQIMQTIGVEKGEIKDKKKEEICAFLPSAGPYNTLSLNDFDIRGVAFTALFAGHYADANVVFSKFRDLLSDFGEYEPDRDIIQAFRRLREDHKLIVKGEKIASILETAVAVNHEINNPLTAIIGNTQLLMMKSEKLPQDIIAKIKAIEQSAMRIKQVTQKLLSVVEPITTGYADNLAMLDIDKSSKSRSEDDTASGHE